MSKTAKLSAVGALKKRIETHAADLIRYADESIRTKEQHDELDEIIKESSGKGVKRLEARRDQLAEENRAAVQAHERTLRRLEICQEALAVEEERGGQGEDG